ncbi:MAG: hypothetical protein HUJ28_09830 [Chromatiales bacterium]|nr:hypothetical protein [Chromatiales bacterium]
MTWEQILTLWSDSIALSVLIWLVILITLLYLARSPAHEALLGLGRGIQRSLRLASRSVMKAEQQAQARNREVLLNMAEEQQQRILEREFHRVNAVVRRDLSGYPALQRQIGNQVAKIDEDYRESTEVPPAPPAWLDAVEAVAKIPSNGDPTVARILEDIHGTLNKASRDAIEEYRAASQKRHLYLKRMMPHWRQISNQLEDVGKTITGLEERAEVIDTQMERFEEMRAKTDRVVNTLSASATKQFFVDGLVMFIAILGGAVNFWLIQRPMSEMVGASTGISLLGLDMNISHIAAIVIVALEVAMGIFLMESLRITRLFPVIGSLDDRMRRRMIWVTFTILFILASIESGLAYMRDLLALQDEALTQEIIQSMRDGPEIVAGEIAGAPPSFRWIPSVAQMILGFILPFALAFVAIPLESFVHSARNVFGRLYAAGLRALAAVLRFIGQFLMGLMRVLVQLYDVIVILPLSIERLVARRGGGGTSAAPAATLATERASPLLSSDKNNKEGKK